MKKMIAFLLLMFGVIGAAFAQSPPYGIYVTQASSDGTFFYGRYMTPADIDVSYLYGYDGPSQKPKTMVIGNGLSYSSGVLAALADGTWSGLTGKPSTFQPSAHTHPASEISDSTATGRAVMTATDAAAARSAIGAGTGNGTVTSITAGAGLTGGTITSSGTIALQARSFSYQTRALNTCFQPSASRDVHVVYPVEISASLSLSGGTVGTVYLRTYTNSSCTTGAQEIMRAVNSNTGSLTIGLNTTQTGTGTLTGIIPAGLWVQQVTENTTGTPGFTARPGQEIQL